MNASNKNPRNQADNENTALTPSQSAYLQNYLPDREAEPVQLTTITNALGLTGPRIKATDLVGRPFIIIGARTFGSSFDEERHAYFCVCRDPETGDIFTTVLGGWAVTDILDAIVASGFDKPLQCTLNVHEGGRYGRYYVLE